MSAFGGKADMHDHLASLGLSAFDPKLSSAGLKFRGAASSVLAGRDTNRRSLARTPQDEAAGDAGPRASRVAPKKTPAQYGALLTHSLLARFLIPLLAPSASWLVPPAASAW